MCAQAAWRQPDRTVMRLTWQDTIKTIPQSLDQDQMEGIFGFFEVRKPCQTLSIPQSELCLVPVKPVSRRPHSLGYSSPPVAGDDLLGLLAAAQRDGPRLRRPRVLRLLPQ
jgi:hypothetical protein